MTWPLSDLALARRLERAEAGANASFVEARAALYPDSGARWIEVAGAFAMFDGRDSPLSQSFGLGLFEEVAPRHLDLLEAFFREGGTPADHEISPLAGPELGRMLAGRGYVPIEHSSVMYRPVLAGAGRAAGPHPAPPHAGERPAVRVVDASEADSWAEISARGWSDLAEAERFMREIGRLVVLRRGSVAFHAEIGGQPVATGALSISGGVALFAGASTLPAHRGRGAQRALLEARLEHASAAGCDLAVMVTQPGSTSQRNAERAGFRVAYTRTKWRKDPA